MQRVDYDDVAPVFDRRYERGSYSGVAQAIRVAMGADPPAAVAEVGCGTGHWLAALAREVPLRIGIDPSARMLAEAAARPQPARLVRGCAEAIPLASSSVAVLLCINAAHHFTNLEAFASEAARVLQPGGRLLIVGLDPSGGGDRWWVYDYFDQARARDERRYPSTQTLARVVRRVGLTPRLPWVAERITGALPVADAEARGLLDARATSQLSLLSASEYEAGRARIREAETAARQRGDSLLLRADLALWATLAVRATPP